MRGWKPRTTLPLLATLLVVLAALPATGSGARAGTVTLEPGSEEGVLVFASPDGRFRWWLDARVYLDAAFFVEDKNQLGDGVQLRRARMAWKTILWGDWYVELDLDFAKEATAVKDAYIRYDDVFGRQGWVRLGNFRVPFGLEENITSRYLIFPERSQGTDPFMPGRRMGVEAAWWGQRHRLAVDFFGPDVEDYETTDQDINLNVAGRFTWAFRDEPGRVVHVGAAAAWRQPTYAVRDGSGGDIRFRSRNEQHVNDYKYLDTGHIDRVDDFVQLGGELAVVRDRFLLQGEYTTTTVHRVGTLEDLTFGGGYVMAALFLTDDTHPYDHTTGELVRVIPRGRHGALEAALRWSHADLTDADVTGGVSDAWTAGLTWYANPNIKIYAAYTQVDNDADADAGGDLVGNDDYGIFQMRFLATF